MPKRKKVLTPEQEALLNQFQNNNNDNKPINNNNNNNISDNHDNDNSNFTFSMPTLSKLYLHSISPLCKICVSDSSNEIKKKLRDFIATQQGSDPLGACCVPDECRGSIQVVAIKVR